MSGGGNALALASIWLTVLAAVGLYALFRWWQTKR